MGEKSGTGTRLPSGLVLVPLHLRPDLFSSCAELLNQTWRRSLGARIHSLERSSDDFPVCLALVENPGGPVLGHVRLCRVIGLADSLFVESVVVSEELRGKGYGRKLMEATERYARGRGFRNMHLTTHDKQYFYSHLGYQLSEPVQNMGSLGSLVPSGMFQTMIRTGNTSSGISTPHAQANGPSPPIPVPPATQTSPCTSKPHPPPPLLSTSPPAPPPPPIPPPLPTTSPPAPPPPPLPPANLPAPPPLPATASPQLPSTTPPPIPPPTPSATLLAFPPPPAPPPLPPTNPPAPPPAPTTGPTTSLSALSPHLASMSLSCPPSHQTTVRTGPDQTLQSPYRDFRGQTIFWMKKSI
uniref:N-alpha-acetyltransferase 80, NatH catalytic subunit n=1 Tax=Leptobrachium leishanense TaxID=445787 RepID=A0A8C5PH12_9ANUR